jgi:hypothetical protein
MPPIATTVDIREKIIAKAISQLGVVESPAYSNQTPYTKWYGITGPWCAMFVSWCFYMAGLPLRITTSKGFAYTPYGVSWFKNNGAWAGPNVRPQRGWVVFFDFIGRVSHVGIVEGIAEDGRIVTLEGNTNAAGSRTGGAVMRHHRRVASGIVGYGIINYQGSNPEELDVDEATLRNIIKSELNQLGDPGRPLDVQNQWTKTQFESAVKSLKAHATTLRNGLRKLIRTIPGADQG